MREPQSPGYYYTAQYNEDTKLSFTRLKLKGLHGKQNLCLHCYQIVKTHLFLHSIINCFQQSLFKNEELSAHQSSQYHQLSSTVFS